MKKTVSRLFAFLLVMIMAMGMLTGCEGKGTKITRQDIIDAAGLEEDNDDKQDDGEEQEDSQAQENSDEEKADSSVIIYESDILPVYFEDVEVAEGGTEVSCYTKYTLEFNQDTLEGSYTEETIYDEYYKNAWTYKGKCEVVGNDIVLTYMADGDPEYTTYYNFTIVDGKITEVKSVYEENCTYEIAGTYKGKSDIFGAITLTIGDDGTATVVSSDRILTGRVFDFDGYWDLMASDNDDSIDWFVFLDGDTFTYQTYASYVYSGMAGTFTIVGDLGDLTLIIDEEGNARLEAELDGKKRTFYGNAFSGEGVGAEYPDSVYLEDENGYCLDLYLTWLDKTTLNYYGTVSRPLGAG